MTERIAERCWGVDLRSLALLRMLLALVQVLMLAGRFSELSIFFTDQGLLPRRWLFEHWDATYWSVYFIDGSYAWAVGCWGVHLAAAVALFVGWRTRWAIALCLVMSWSLQVRNPYILTAGDVLLRVNLAWLLLLPCMQCWSLDAKRSMARVVTVRPHVSVASAGILVQLTCLYFCAGLAKCNADWFSGRATEMALQLEMHVRPAGTWLLQWPAWLAVVSWATLAAEWAAPLLILSPFQTRWLRLLGAVIFIAFHLGIWLTMSVGWFSLIAIVSWSVLIPAGVWDRLAARWPVLRLAKDSSATGEPGPFAPRANVAGVNVAGAFLFCLMVALNIASFLPASMQGAPVASLRRVANLLMFNQEFKMFAEPPRISPSWEYSGQLANGETADPFWVVARGGQRERHPQSPYRYLGSHAWRRYHWHLAEPFDSELSPPLQRARNELRTLLLDVIVRRFNAGRSASDSIRQATLVARMKAIEVPRSDEPSLASEIWARYPVGDAQANR